MALPRASVTPAHVWLARLGVPHVSWWGAPGEEWRSWKKPGKRRVMGGGHGELGAAAGGAKRQDVAPVALSVLDARNTTNASGNGI